MMMKPECDTHAGHRTGYLDATAPGTRTPIWRAVPAISARNSAPVNEFHGPRPPCSSREKVTNASLSPGNIVNAGHGPSRVTGVDNRPRSYAFCAHRLTRRTGALIGVVDRGKAGHRACVNHLCGR